MRDPFEQRAENYKALALTLAQMFANTDKAQREQLARELALMVPLEQETHYSPCKSMTCRRGEAGKRP